MTWWVVDGPPRAPKRERDGGLSEDKDGVNMWCGRLFCQERLRVGSAGKSEVGRLPGREVRGRQG